MAEPARSSEDRDRPRSIRARSSGTTAASGRAAARKVERRSAVKRSNVRFWVTLLVLAFVTAFVILAAWHEVQMLFGV